MCVLVRDVEDIQMMNFHLVDLQKKRLVETVIPCIHYGEGMADGCAVLAKYNIFILGGVFEPADDPKHETHTHLGCSFYSLLYKKWNSCSLPRSRLFPNPASISNEIYCFGLPRLHPELLTFKRWCHLDSSPLKQNLSVSSPVVSDEDNSRFLVHFCGTDELYAFHPPKQPPSHYQPPLESPHSWELIASSIYTWTDTVAVADNILFFHDWYFTNLLLAYDLKRNKWLTVVADLRKVLIRVRVFQSLFSLPGEGLMCLASKLPPRFNKQPASAHFLRFKFERTDNLGLKLTAIDYQFYFLPSDSTISDFIMLKGDLVPLVVPSKLK